MAAGTDLSEHATTLVAVIGGLLVIAQSLVAVIFLGMKGDLREIKTSMQVFTVEIFERLRKAEMSIAKLWTEHRLTQEMGCTEHHHHDRLEDKLKREATRDTDDTL